MAISKIVLNRQSDLILTGAVITAPTGIVRGDVGLSNVDNTSDLNKPVSLATSAAITAAVVGLYDDRGNYDASAGLFPADGDNGSGPSGSVLKGDIWTVSVGGTVGGIVVSVGDLIRALEDAPGQDASKFATTEQNFGYVAENAANKVTSLSSASTDVEYASAKAVFDQLQLKVVANAPITAGTGTKVTFDAKGLVTGAVDATTADIAPSVDRNYVTDAQVVLAAMYFHSSIVTGVQDSSNKVFTIGALVRAGSEQVLLNGQMMNPGAGNDYTISGTTITFSEAFTAPVSTDAIRIYGVY